MKGLRLSAAALRDLREATAYVAQENPAAAERLRVRLLEAGEMLREFPTLGALHLGGPARMLAVPGTRYRFLYRPHAQGITILRIHHGARQWPPAPG